MKILNISKYNFNYSGGIEKEAKEVSKQLSKLGLVDTLCFGQKKSISRINENEKVIEYKSFKIFKKVDVSFSLFLYILRNKKRYDVIWLHYPNILPVIALLIFRNSSNIILHWHNDIQVLPVLYKIFKPLEKIIIQKSKRIITTSPEYHKFSNSLSHYQQKIITIPIRIEANNPIVHRIIPECFNEIILTTIGRYTPYKGYRELLSIVNKNQKLKLNLISKSQFPPDLQAIISNSSNIIHYRNASDKQVNEILLNSHIYLMSSVTRNEGYGIALLEALRCGIPLCVNKIIGTGSAFIVKPGYNGEFFDINKEDSLLNSINKITNKENYEKYCDNALNDFNKRFSLENNKDYFYFLSQIKK